jgi:HAD superfamily hydrolase (TIGR01509 family)
MHKYLVLDFGGVIAVSPSRDWNMTPKFLELIDINKLDVDKFRETSKKYGYILSEVINTLEEEYDMFTRFYDSIFRELDYPGYNIEIAKTIAYDRTYNPSKYELCNNVINELEELKDKYKIILLTDNWPCVYDYLKVNNLDKYFDKVYVSSIYGSVKRDGTFFDYPIVDYDIKPGEAIFIDDYELNLDVAKTKGFDVYLMDRDNIVSDSKHEIIHDLLCLSKKINK